MGDLQNVSLEDCYTLSTENLRGSTSSFEDFYHMGHNAM
jgi:hypothetical protein